MNSRGTKLVFLELEKMAQWITTCTVLIWGSELEPPALTKRAWHKCSRLWLQYCTVEIGRSWTLPGQPALPKQWASDSARDPASRQKGGDDRGRHLVFCSGLNLYKHMHPQTHLYAEYTHACTWTHTQTQFIRNCMFTILPVVFDPWSVIE